MSDIPFLTATQPFQSLWQKLRVAVIAVFRTERWISVSTRITLSYLQPEADIFVQPVPDFIAFCADAPLSTLEELLRKIDVKGCVETSVADKQLQVFLTYGHARGDPTPQRIQLGVPPFSTLTNEHESCFQLGDSRLAISTQLEHLYNVMSYDQLNTVSSKLRVHKPPYDGIAGLARKLAIPFERNQNQTTLEIAAPLPFSLSYDNDSTASVSAPRKAINDLQLVGFFDQGHGTAELKETQLASESVLSVVQGTIPWPEQSRNGKLCLFFRENEVGAVSVQRWLGTSNWKVQVEEFFDPSRDVLRSTLAARQEQTVFEHAVVRLLNQLGIATVWYGDRRYHDRPDLAACIELKGDWIVLLGECTVQKPSVKFTPLLSRTKILETLLQNEARIFPAVFTCSPLSAADREQARQDGILMVGPDELASLLQGVDQNWGPENAIKYLFSLLRTGIGILY